MRIHNFINMNFIILCVRHVYTLSAVVTLFVSVQIAHFTFAAANALSILQYAHFCHIRSRSLQISYTLTHAASKNSTAKCCLPLKNHVSFIIYHILYQIISKNFFKIKKITKYLFDFLILICYTVFKTAKYFI